MQQIKDRWQECSLCNNCQTIRKVFGSGNLQAKVAVVGEGPGKDEVADLTPFVGAAGKLLTAILLGIGLKREDVFFTNAVICRTDDKNRTPTKQEAFNCRNRLVEELSIVNPQYILTAGNAAFCTVMQQDCLMKNVHGRWHLPKGFGAAIVYPIYHPSWILRAVNEGEKKHHKDIMLADIRKFREDIGALDQWKLEVKK